jgi:hypothetical protein
MVHGMGDSLGLGGGRSGRVPAGERSAIFSGGDMILGLEEFGVEFGEGRDVGIPFEEGRDALGASVGAAVEIPDGIDDGVIVGIDEMGLAVSVAREMELHDTPVRNLFATSQ